MTPLQITILIDACTLANGGDANLDVSAEGFRQASELAQLGLLELYSVGGKNAVRGTSRGEAHLKALQSIPLPEWRTPWEKAV